MGMLVYLRMNFPINFPLYAMKLNFSNIYYGNFYLSVAVSNWFPDGPIQIRYHHETLPAQSTGTMRKVNNMMRCNGWTRMINQYHYREEDTIVLCMSTEEDGAIAMRIFPVADH
ncbi:unnamed protein product [Urochloa humidicola]